MIWADCLDSRSVCGPSSAANGLPTFKLRVRYRNAALTLPAELCLPDCRRCKYEPLGLDTLPPELLESLYRDNLQKCVAVAIARRQGFKSQRRTELLMNLSQGYLSRLKAGYGVPEAPLVSLLALLGANPPRLEELKRYWALPVEASRRLGKRKSGA